MLPDDFTLVQIMSNSNATLKITITIKGTGRSSLDGREAEG